MSTIDTFVCYYKRIASLVISLYTIDLDNVDICSLYVFLYVVGRTEFPRALNKFMIIIIIITIIII